MEVGIFISDCGFRISLRTNTIRNLKSEIRNCFLAARAVQSLSDVRQVLPTRAFIYRSIQVLANPGSLFQVWQLPLVLVFIVAWLAGGGVLFRRSLSRLSAGKGITLGKGVLVSFLAGLAGCIAAGAVFVVCHKALDRPVVSLLIAAPIFPIMAYLIIFSMFNYSPSQTLRAALLPLVAIMLAAGAVGAACGIPAVYTRRAYLQEQKHIQTTRIRLDRLFQAMSLKPEKPPKTLQDLLEISGVEPAWLKSPANDKRKVGFFYLQPNHLSSPDDTAGRYKILACDFIDNFANYPKPGRTVLYATGRVEFLPSSSFNSLLAKPENKAFAKALKEADQ